MHLIFFTTAIYIFFKNFIWLLPKSSVDAFIFQKCVVFSKWSSIAPLKAAPINERRQASAYDNTSTTTNNNKNRKYIKDVKLQKLQTNLGMSIGVGFGAAYLSLWNALLRPCCVSAQMERVNTVGMCLFPL